MGARMVIAERLFIEGIEQYCDNWCARCPMTSRCLAFAVQKRGMAGDLAQNPRMLRVLLEREYQAALEGLTGVAECAGDLQDQGPFATLGGPEEQGQAALVWEQELCRLASAYVEMAEAWFLRTESFYREEGGVPRFPGPDGNTALEREVEEAVEVVQWYQNQITTKLHRAVLGRFFEEAPEPEGFARDSDGAAKVALLGIDRSVAAWSDLGRIYMIQGREIEEIVAHLGHLKKRVQEAFPCAQEFIRPGFDRVPLNA